MSPTASEREPRWADAAALILLSVAGTLAWWGDLGSGLLWLAPLIAIAAMTTAGLLEERVTGLVAIAWLPVSILVAGHGLGTLAPAALDTTTSSIHKGVQALSASGVETPLVHSWALAAALLGAGMAILLAGILWSQDGWVRTALGLALVLVPLGGAIAAGQSPDASWQGALILIAVVLRVARGRLVPIFAATAMVGVLALFGAQVAAPRAGWEPFGPSHSKPQFHEFLTRQTYGPLEDRRTGAVMLEVTAERPALWRMQVMEAFDNRRWRIVKELSHLPEPAAQKRSIKVRVRGLNDKVVIAPGNVLDVHGAGPTTQETGHATALHAKTKEGEEYRVVADQVETSAARLARIPIPTGRQYEPLTQIGEGPPPRVPQPPLAKLATNIPLALQATNWERLIDLGYRLSHGVKTELKMVRRVEDYLLLGGRYRYTTEVEPPTSEPILQFLFETHAGYCQQFAGAAALLLRVTGVPTRVVAGFATGEEIGRDTWAVRDEDAHAWIEVYFPGVGWVPFNPTPSAAKAVVYPGIDVLQPGVARAGGPSGTLPVLVGCAAALLFLGFATRRMVRRRRGPRRQLPELLVRLTPQTSGSRTTLRSLHATLKKIGPRTADLALVAERARFAAAEPVQPSHPNFMVWRALVADVGLFHASALMLRVAAPTVRA